MQSDFLDAHERHLEDAELLWEKDRLANADHLYGVSAECGLKGLMLAFGMPFDSNLDQPRPREGKDRVHANGIWGRYEVYRSGHVSGAGYPLTSPNPFDDWHVCQRYAHRTKFDAERVQRHRMGAEEVQKIVKEARLGGLI